MIEGEYQRPEEIPGFVYYHIPEPKLFVPAPPSWTHPELPKPSKETGSIEFLLLPKHEKYVGETSLLISVLPKFFKQEEHGDPHEFILNQFNDRSLKIDQEGIASNINGNIIFAQAQGERLMVNPDKDFPLHYVFRTDALNVTTGTYYMSVFHTPNNIENIIRFSPTVKLIMNNTAYNPEF